METFMDRMVRNGGMQEIDLKQLYLSIKRMYKILQTG